jgi:uncharacterized membrane protein YvbJ
MAFCKNCGNQVNDGTKFCPKCGQAVDGEPQQQVYQQPAQAYQQPQQHRAQPNSNMVLAILTTIFCCLPTGIYAIIQASKVDKLYMSGEYDEAIRVAGEAKKWSYIGIVLAVIGWIIYFVFFMGLGFLAAVGGAQ